jgi:hypothetical protein
MKTKDILIPALRQYQHNNGSGLLKGFDYDETMKIVDKLQNTRDALIKDIATTFYYSWHNSTGTNTDEGFDDWWKLNKVRFVES